MIRGTHGVTTGCIYYEAHILTQSGPQSHYRCVRDTYLTRCSHVKT